MRTAIVILAIIAFAIAGLALLARVDRAAPVVGFDLIEFFQQPTEGEGTIRALNFDVDRFEVRTEGFREGEVGRMLERFFHADGRRRLQDWTLRFLDGRSGAHGYVATRPDLKGPSVFRPVDERTYGYTWHQWLDPETKSDLVTLRGRVRLMEDGSLLNRAIVFKSIFPVAVVHVVFRPVAG